MKEPEVLVMSEDWLSLEEARSRLGGRSQRNLQKLAKAGNLKVKRQPRKGRGPETLYFAKDVARLAEEMPLKNRKAPAPRAPLSNAATASQTERAFRPPQTERALDMVAIVGNMAAGHKGQIEALVGQSTRQIEALVTQSTRQIEMLMQQSAQNLQTVVGLILSAQKAEADANRERIKADREDARERWELERQDRAAKLERQRQNLVSMPSAKAKRAHA